MADNVPGKAAMFQSGKKPVADTTNQLIRSVFIAFNKETAQPQINIHGS